MARRHSLAIVAKPTAAVVAKSTAASDASKEAQTLRLPPELWHQFRVVAAMRRGTMAGLVQEAMEAYAKSFSSQEKTAARK
jgi:hypothetical protein